tara:strand:+ start:694 stop:1320 length:627 start_codon:yes stop_codon:yes gene_type:complete
MILIITTDEINLKKHLQIKNVEKLNVIGQVDLIIGNSISLKDEVIYFKSSGSKVELRVGLKWICKNYEITSIIFFDYVSPINNNLLENHFIIPKKITSIDDPPLEWSNNPLIDSLEANITTNSKIRKVIFETNFDFLYGNILSIDEQFINENIINELKNLGQFDAINNLAFSLNKFANENNIDIYNICIGKTVSMEKIKFKILFEKLF